MAMLYFVLVKPVIGALSFLSVLLVLAPTVSFIASLASEYQAEYDDSIQIYGVNSTSMRQYPGLSLVGAICVTLLGAALMQLVAKISLGATRFFCCEKIAVTTRFAPYQYQTLSTNGVTSYGTTSIRSTFVNLLDSATMVEKSNTRLYPTFEAQAPVEPRYSTQYATANVPPVMAETERWPLTSAAPVTYAQSEYNEYYVPPSYGQPRHQRHCHPQEHWQHRGRHCHHHRHSCKSKGFLLSTLKLALFHVLNALLGIVAFVAVVTGVHVAMGLIPLCCVGLLVFRGVVVLVQWLAKLDVKLSNYIGSPDERVLVAEADQPLGGFEGLRLSPELGYFSPVSLLGALYFATVKFVISIVSIVVVSLFASLPMMLLAYSDDDDTDWYIKLHHHKTIDLHQYPLTFYVLWGCLFILTVVAMHLVAWLSRALTSFFCCERVTASEYTIPIVQYSDTGTMYGSNAPTTRINL